MATKKKTVRPPQAELLAPTAADGSPKPLVKLEIARPEPLLAGAQKLLTQAQAFKVDSTETYTQGANARQEIRAQLDGMKARHKKMKAPIKEAEREVDELFKPAIEVLEDAMEVITDSLTDYDAAQRRLAEQRRQEAEAEAKRQREELERAARAERERQAAAERERERQEAVAREAQLRKEREAADARAAQEKAQREAAQAAAAGDRARAEAAEADAAAERKRAIEARKAQLRAEQEAQAQRDAAAREREAAAARARALEQQAAAVRVEEVKDEPVEVEGLSRATTWGYDILDESKIKREFLVPNVKLINATVKASKERAIAIIGEGSIRAYPITGIRQQRS